jgi:hypothetical protein
MDEAWNRWDGPSNGRSDQASDEAGSRLSGRSGSFREPPGTGSLRNRGAGASRDGRRPGRGAPEPLEQRLDRWVSRGRELVDGVAGARPGSRMAGPEGAGLGHRGLGAGGLTPARLGRWVEERFDWLLDDDGEDDWREPWQEPAREIRRRPAGPAAVGSPDARRPERPSDPWAASPPVSPSPRRSDPQPRRAVASERRSLEAVSRRPSQIGTIPSPPQPPSGGASRKPVGGPSPAPAAEGYAALAHPEVGYSSGAGAAIDAAEAWPDDASFTLQRWQRTPRPPGPEPLAPEPPEPPDAAAGRRLPRSTRRR